MKKTFVCMLLCLMATMGWADEQKKVTLSSDHNKEAINLSYLNIFVSLSQADDDKGNVNIELENLSESKVLILFDRSYTEKQAKKMTPKLQFDKTFGGTKGMRIIDPYSYQLTRVMQFRPSDKYTLPIISVESEQPVVVTLPIYIAKWKGSKKLILLEKQEIELDIEAELKPSAEFVDMSKRCDDLLKEIESNPICTNKNHKPSADKQREALQAKIDGLKSEIDGIISKHAWASNDNGYRRFNDLKEKFANVQFAERDCGRHGSKPKAGHQCSYCSLSLQQIYHKLDDLYKKIYTSNDRQATKASVMGQVNGLYNCCVDANCEKHAAAWSNGGDYKNKIIERYNRIQGL